MYCSTCNNVSSWTPIVPSFRMSKRCRGVDLCSSKYGALRNPNPGDNKYFKFVADKTFLATRHYLHIMSKEAYVPPTRDASSPAASSTPAGGLQTFSGVTPRAPAAISYLCAGNP